MLPGYAATPAIWGKIVDQSNKPIAGVKINLTQLGKSIANVTTSTDGSYSFDSTAGAYSLQIIPPTSGYSSLNAFNISAPQTQPITFTLTPPSPGRSFLTGHVTATAGFQLNPTTTSIGFGGFGSYLQDNAGSFRLLPTAGTKGAFWN